MEINTQMNGFMYEKYIIKYITLKKGCNDHKNKNRENIFKKKKSLIKTLTNSTNNYNIKNQLTAHTLVCVTRVI